jgi:hypothetical protein
MGGGWGGGREWPGFVWSELNFWNNPGFRWPHKTRPSKHKLHLSYEPGCDQLALFEQCKYYHVCTLGGICSSCTDVICTIQNVNTKQMKQFVMLGGTQLHSNDTLSVAAGDRSNAALVSRFLSAGDLVGNIDSFQ